MFKLIIGFILGFFMGVLVQNATAQDIKIEKEIKQPDKLTEAEITAFQKQADVKKEEIIYSIKKESLETFILLYEIQE